MPEVGDLTPSKHDVVTTKRSFVVSVKKIRTRSQVVDATKVADMTHVVLSRGKEPPKAGRMTGVKS